MLSLKECTWYVVIGNCIDDEKEATVWYWSVTNIKGENGVAQDGMEMWAADNYDTEEIAKTKWQEFARINGIKKWRIKKG